jgi:propionyl-CoA carboxylase alpha chain
MNTRLQVEHPVTEFITGLDLVELMIRVAAGEELSIGQKDVKLEGWAVETRIYAEDPYRGFLPSTGRLTKYHPPEEKDGVRIDTGVIEGSEISMFYDPMIAKLVTFGANRSQAIERMAFALDRFKIRGVSHNINFLAAVMANERFQSGNITTGFIAEEFPSGFNGLELSTDVKYRVYAVVAAFELSNDLRKKTISGQVSLPLRAGFENKNLIDLNIQDGDNFTDVVVKKLDAGYEVSINSKDILVVGDCKPGTELFDGSVDGVKMVIQIDRSGTGYAVGCGGAGMKLKVISSRFVELTNLMPVKQPPDMSNFLLSPMPGLLVSIAVSEGEIIKLGQELAVVEAMKMENVMKAERDGVVAKIHAAVGGSLSVDQPIIEFE